MPPGPAEPWPAMFQALGCRVGLPAASRPDILAQVDRLCGPVLAVGSCLPLRAAAGRFISAVPQADVLFLPTLGCGGCTARSRLAALDRMLQAHGWPPAVFPRSAAQDKDAASLLPDVARALNLPENQVRDAHARALARTAHDMELARELTPSRKPSLAVMGNPALTRDPGLNGGLLRALSVRGYRPVTALPAAGPLPPNLTGAVFLEPAACAAACRDAQLAAARLSGLPMLTLTFSVPPAFGRNAAKLAAFLDSLDAGRGTVS